MFFVFSLDDIKIIEDSLKRQKDPGLGIFHQHEDTNVSAFTDTDRIFNTFTEVANFFLDDFYNSLLLSFLQ